MRSRWLHRIYWQVEGHRDETQPAFLIFFIENEEKKIPDLKLITKHTTSGLLAAGKLPNFTALLSSIALTTYSVIQRGENPNLKQMSKPDGPG